MIEEVKPLVEAGFSVHLLRPKSKIPANDGWSEAPVYTFDQLRKLYRDGQNVGIRLGKPSKVEGLYLHAIDLDIRVPEAKSEALDRLDELISGVDLKELPRVQSGSGGASRHFYFLTEDAFRSKKLAHSKHKFTGDDGKEHWEWEIELFGTGKQVVLPPSIHPDTGKAYRWVLQPDLKRGIPRISADLIDDLVGGDESTGFYENSEPLNLTIDEARHYLDAIPDWADDRETWVRVGMALKHEFADDKALIKDAWELFDEWSRRGYGYNRAKNLAQWRGFKFDREELVTMRSIVAEANDRALYETINELEDEDGPPAPPSAKVLMSMFDDLDGPPAPSSGQDADPYTMLKREGVPDHVLSIPGVLQEVVDYYNATAIKPQPQFAVQAALAFGSVVLGRHWSTNRKNFTSLYFLNLAPTAGGKEHAKRVIEEFLTEAGLDTLTGPKNYASEAGVFSTLLTKPRHICITDEFGRYLSSARGGAGNANKSEAQSALMEVFGRLDGMWQTNGYSTRGMTKEQADAQNNAKVVRPALTLLGMTTPQSFYDALGQKDILDGFLNRFLIVESPLGRQSSREVDDSALPKRVVRWARQKAWEIGGDDDDLEGMRAMVEPSFAPEPVLVPFSKACGPILAEMEQAVSREMDRLDACGMAELYGRTREIAMRMSLIVAVSDDCDVIRPKHLEWARDYVFFYQARMAKLFEGNIGKTDIEKACDAVCEYLETCGDEGAPEYKIADNRRKKFGKLSTRERDEVFALLLRDRRIRVTDRTAKRGPKKPWYVLVK